MPRLRTLLSLLIICVCFLLPAQENTYIQFTLKDGLPSNNVYYTFQDSKGYLWIGTDKGVSRYDGYSFTNYTISDGLSDSDIFQIYEDSRQRIWFVTHNGKLCYYKSGKFYSHENTAFLAAINSTGMGLKIAEDKEGNIWYLTLNCLIKISPDGLSKDYLKTYQDKKKFSNFTMEYLNNDICVLTSRGAFLVKKDSLFFVPVSGLERRQSVCKSFSEKEYLYYSIVNEFRMFNALTGKNDCIIKISNPLNFVCRKDTENFYLGTDNGLKIFNINTKEQISVYSPEYKISHIGTDKEFGRWISTLNAGIIYVPNTNSIKLNTGTSEQMGNVFSIKKMENGDICLGSDNHRFCIIRNGINHFFQSRDINGKGIVKAFTNDRKGYIYSVSNSLLICIDPELRHLLHQEFSARGIYFFKDTVYSLSFSTFFKTASSAFNRKKIEPDFIATKINIIKSGIPLKGMITDRDSIIYTYGSNQLTKYNIYSRKYEAIENKGKLRDLATINTLSNDNKGTLFIGGQNALWILSKNDTISLREKDGLRSAFINSIFYDSIKNVLWLATEGGISRLKNFNRTNAGISPEIENLDIYNGLPDKQVNDILVYNDTIWIASASGVTKIPESGLAMKAYTPFLNIEKIETENEVRYPDAGNVIEFTYGKTIRIHFTGISLHYNNSLFYKYQLQGINNNWVSTKARVLEFPQLPPGDYTLRLIAVNKHGSSSAEKKLNLKILPLFYQTNWFKILVGLLLIFLIVFFAFLIIRKQKKRMLTERRLLELENQKLDAEKKQALHEKELLLLEQKALRLHINPHFIFNSISAISGFYVSGEYEKGKEYTAKFSKLLRLILTATSNPTISLASEIQILENYFDLMLLRFENKFAYSIQIDEKIDAQNTHIPCMLFQPLAENALLHGIAPLNRKGAIIISVRAEGEFLICSVEDNGVGRKKAKENSAGKIGASTGMMVTQQRIELHNKLVEGLKITDKTETNGESEGTIVEFRILFQNKTTFA